MVGIISSGVSIFMTAVAGYLTWLAQQTYKKKQADNKALMILMRRELRELHDKYMAEGEISPYSLGEFEEIYQIYHDLGGNGTGTVWKNDVEGLERS